LNNRKDDREANLELAIEMSDVTLRICWDSLKQHYPNANHDELITIFKQRIGSRSRFMPEKSNN
jgi:hypothetical protein